MVCPAVHVCTCLHQAGLRLSAAHVDSPRLSAEVLLAFLLDVDRLWLMTHPQAPLLPKQVERFDALLARRARGEPVAYLTGQKEFFGINLQVSPAVLIPRPETEVIVHTALDLLPAEASLRFVDLGTGSGALGLAFASVFKNSHGQLTDVCPQALEVAQKNICALELQTRITCLCADMLSCLRSQCVDVVLANPPYVGTSRFWAMSPEVRAYEPALALWGGVRGWEFPCRVLWQSEGLLPSGGWLFMEIEEEQAPVLEHWLQVSGSRAWGEFRVIQDGSGLDRVVALQRV